MTCDIACQRCGSKRVNKCGFRDTQFKGRIQKYKCRDCRTSFSLNRFKRFRVGEATIEQILDLNKKEFSAWQIAKKIKSMSHASVSNIINRFGVETPQICRNCGKQFIKKGFGFCSDSCRKRYASFIRRKKYVLQKKPYGMRKRRM